MNKSQEQIKKLTIRIWTNIFSMLIISIFIISISVYNFQVKAFTIKSTSDILTSQEWNDLQNDFIPAPMSCNNGEVLQWSGGGWICASGGGLGQPDFDSGWRPIALSGNITLVFDTVQPGNTLTANNQDFYVEFSGSANSNGSNSHITALGSEISDNTGATPGWASNGAHWYDLTDNDITVQRQPSPENDGRLDSVRSWNYFRIRIWDTSQ